VEAKKPGKLTNKDHEVELNMKQRAQSTEHIRGICLLQATLFGLVLWRASLTTIQDWWKILGALCMSLMEECKVRSSDTPGYMTAKEHHCNQQYLQLMESRKDQRYIVHPKHRLFRNSPSYALILTTAYFVDQNSFRTVVA
jgi:hypothetical protein